MTYRCGLGEGMAALGFTPREPHVVCDGCGAVERGVDARGWPKRWLQNGKGPPGWEAVRIDMGDEGVMRTDWCRACQASRAHGTNREE